MNPQRGLDFSGYPNDSPHRPFFLIAGLLLSLVFIGGQSVTRLEHYRFVAKLGKPPPELEAIPGVHPREVVLPATSVDSCWWIMHTEAMLEAGDWRVRETTRDNAPEGREVHWSSGLMWMLAALAWLIHLASGLSTVSAVQHAGLIVGPLMLAGFILAFACLAARRWGGAAAGLLALALATLAPLDSFFCVGEADHHGVVSCFGLGCVLAAVAAGGGRVARQGATVASRAPVPRRATARRWMIASGLLGAAGLWVSSATIVPLFVGVAAGALLAAWQGRRAGDDGETEAAPGLWRLWGTAGAAGSLAFYLLEYAPHHLGWRLEVNHPLYALALWGAGELLCRACSWIHGDGFAGTLRARLLALAAGLALGALPLAIIIGGVGVFSIQDPFLWNLHKGYIIEFRPITRFLADATWEQLVAIFPVWPLLALPAAWMFFGKRGRTGATAPIALALCAPLPLTALSLLQVRWVGAAQTSWLALAVAGLACWLAASPRPSRAAAIAASFIIIAGIGALPVISVPHWGLPAKLSPDETTSLVMRDIAWKLRLTSGPKPINIVGGPTTTTTLAYYGDTRGVGTLYWENIAGLKTVGSIYGAADEEEALRICREHAVTHIVIFSWDAFAQPYARLFHGRPVDADTSDCFVSSLLVKRSIPRWLRPLPYAMPPELAAAGEWALVCEVQPEQSPAEAFYYLGKYLSATGRAETALNVLIQSWNLDPASVATGLELGRSMIRADRVAEAREIAARLPPAQRLVIEAGLGRHFLDRGRHEDAAAAFRRALGLSPNDRELVADLGWLLATSDVPSVRDGAEALRLMTPLSEGGQSLTVHEADALAAAYAETGRFDDAVSIIARAIEETRREKNQAMENELETRRSRYAHNQPFRMKEERPAPFSPATRIATPQR